MMTFVQLIFEFVVFQVLMLLGIFHSYFSCKNRGYHYEYVPQVIFCFCMPLVRI